MPCLPGHLRYSKYGLGHRGILAFETRPCTPARSRGGQRDLAVTVLAAGWLAGGGEPGRKTYSVICAALQPLAARFPGLREEFLPHPLPHASDLGVVAGQRTPGKFWQGIVKPEVME